jgi:hypothetical protein
VAGEARLELAIAVLETGAFTAKRDPQCRAKRERVRGMLEDRFALGSFTNLPDLWSRRLLR